MPIFFVCANFSFFPLQALLPLRRCPFFLNDSFGSHAPRVFPSSLSLPSEGRDRGGQSRDALVLLPRGFSSPPARLGPAGGVEEPLVARSVHASSLLSPQFIRGLGIQELLSCGGLLLPFFPGWFSLLISACSAWCWGGRIFVFFFSVLGCPYRLISARSARCWGGWVCRVPLQLGSSLASRSLAWEAGRVL